MKLLSMLARGLALTALLCVFFGSPQHVVAQGSLMLNMGMTANNGNYGISFDVTALKSTKIHRFWIQASAGTTTAAVWYNPNGLVVTPGVNTGYNPTGWIQLGTATVNGLGYGVDVEVPLDINILMNPGDRYGFAIVLAGGAGLSYRTGVAPWIIADSYLEVNTQAWAGGFTPPLATTSMFFPRQFCGRIYYDEGCYFPDGVISYEILDGNLQPTSFANIPGSVNLRYSVNYPNEETNVGVTVNFRNVITDAIVYTYNFTATKQAGQPLNAIQNIPLPANVPSGYMRVEVIFNSKNSCLNYANYTAPSSTLLLLPPGATMCIVWPGDTDNNGVVNYSDRRSLNDYIHEANLRATWLEGPTRFSVIGGLDYLAWRGQPSAPWQTPDGCYKDTDGNGLINNFDYIAIKLNWLRSNTAIPTKDGAEFSMYSFDMDQNYPNPFNPETNIRYSAPERSQVRLVVTDMLGREVATLVDGAVEEGVYTVQFDAGNLPSGSYIATVHMTGLESGLTFSKNIGMALSK